MSAEYVAVYSWVCIETDPHVCTCAGVGHGYPHEDGCGLEPLFETPSPQYAESVVKALNDHTSALARIREAIEPHMQAQGWQCPCCAAVHNAIKGES